MSKTQATNGHPDPCSGSTKIADGTGSIRNKDLLVDGDDGSFLLLNHGVGDPILERTGEVNSVCIFVSVTTKCPTSDIG
ncbi:uncharacterized protein PG986_012114 [Apiospora aurea]|uniref:Uncharacterized protein n=1 Tax=Apiospora aurea TaxID=335848 RepID=A0ABR1PZ43_9PEZI